MGVVGHLVTQLSLGSSLSVCFRGLDFQCFCCSARTSTTAEASTIEHHCLIPPSDSFFAYPSSCIWLAFLWNSLVQEHVHDESHMPSNRLLRSGLSDQDSRSTRRNRNRFGVCVARLLCPTNREVHSPESQNAWRTRSEALSNKQRGLYVAARAVLATVTEKPA